jgi:uncharacterized membrane protein YedE/YeeE
MDHFTPVSGLIGGLLIGLSAATFVLLNGRVAGISGIVGGLFSDQVSELSWRLAFVAGIVIGPFLVQAVRGTGAEIVMQVDTPLLVLGGLLVGFGSRLGSGCTSGHGICGLARGSERSLAATAAFFGIALVTVFLMRHVIGG